MNVEKKYCVVCTKIFNGTIYVTAETPEKAVENANEILSVNPDACDWTFGEATADFADSIN